LPRGLERCAGLGRGLLEGASWRWTEAGLIVVVPSQDKDIIWYHFVVIVDSEATIIFVMSGAGPSLSIYMDT
jgi:hypothetical protein